MSTTIIPDIYRHTARKSTVSRNVKSISVVCNSTFNLDKNSKSDQSIFDTIKLEKDITEEQSFILLPDNDIEEMIVEQTNDEIIYDILEQIKNQINEYPSNSIQTLSVDIHNVMDSLMNHLDETDEFLSSTIDVQMEDVNRSLDTETSMESDQQSSILSHIDDDIVEIGVSTSNINSHICTCQCHQITSNCLLPTPTNEYILFEQALHNTRQEQQQEKSLNNNRLIQTLKRQHQELMNFYQRKMNINTIDREQQTIKINLNDSQMQTDITTIPQNPKPNIYMNGIHSTANQKGPTTTNIRSYTTFLTPIRTTGPSLQQLIPCLSTVTTSTTTTLTNKTSIAKTNTIVATTNSHPQPPPPAPPLSASASHDIVDLTEEDEEDNRNRIAAQITTPQPNVTSQNPPTSSSSSAAAAAAAVVSRIRPPNRASHPNTTIPSGQTFLVRPILEHTPCDHTITRPQLSIAQDNTTVRLTWNLPATPMEAIQNYEIYAYKQNATVTISDWKKIGTVKSMRLPMAVTLKEFQSNSHYAFAVRAVSINNNVGPFCEPKTIFTGNTLVQPLHTSQVLNIST